MEYADFMEKMKKHKYETRKYHEVARHLELLAIHSELEKIQQLENNEYIKPYIKYIGGIGGSRALEFCVSAPSIESKGIQTIEYILEILRKEKRKIPEPTATHMLNTAIIHHKYELLEYLITNPVFSNKFNFEHGNSMVIRNMLNKDEKDPDKNILKKLLVEKVILLNEKNRSLIEKSQEQSVINALAKIDLKEKIENKLIAKEEVKIKKKKI